jgi:hypothetical protein
VGIGLGVGVGVGDDEEKLSNLLSFRQIARICNKNQNSVQLPIGARLVWQMAGGQDVGEVTKTPKQLLRTITRMQSLN